MFCFCSSFSVYVEAELPIGMSMWIYLPMRINMDIRIIRHMSDIARYMRRIFQRGILSIAVTTAKTAGGAPPGGGRLFLEYQI